MLKIHTGAVHEKKVTEICVTLPLLSILMAVLLFVLSFIVVTSKFVAFIIPLITYPIAVIVNLGIEN